MVNTTYSLYILRCNDGSLYTGIATDIDRRLAEHEWSERGAQYLRGRGPLRLEFVEVVGSRALAQRIEHRVKRMRRTAKEALIAGQTSLAELTGH